MEVFGTTTLKRLVLKCKDGKEYVFMYPSIFKEEDVVPVCQGIRFGYEHNWDRKLNESEIVSLEEVGSVIIRDEMKYITVGDINAKFMMVFDKEIDHDRMFENVGYMVCCRSIQPEIELACHSAGFVKSDLFCHGHSGTIGVEAIPQDNKIIRSGLKSF